VYTVDLLKGEGIPIRSRPMGIAFACLVVTVPLVVAIAMAGAYMDRRVTLSIQSQELTKLQKMVGTMSDAMGKKRSLEQKKIEAGHCLADVKTALGGHTQWSPAVAALVESLPDALVLTKLEARLEFIRVKMPAKGDPKTIVDTSVPVRTLAVSVCGRDKEASYRAVRDLQDRLRASAALGPRLSTITVAQESGTLEGDRVLNYELTCAFKPSIE
jgi:Tfp pilus assembly protein PilN